MTEVLKVLFGAAEVIKIIFMVALWFIEQVQKETDWLSVFTTPTYIPSRTTKHGCMTVYPQLIQFGLRMERFKCVRV